MSEVVTNLDTSWDRPAHAKRDPERATRCDHRGGVSEGWLTIERLVAEARDDLDRMTPAEAMIAQRSGAALVDIRSEAQRARNGAIPGAACHARNVLEWRLDPACEHRDPDLARRDRRVILICDEGCQSSLAAATIRRFGVDASDVIGGFQAWRAAGLPIE